MTLVWRVLDSCYSLVVQPLGLNLISVPVLLIVNLKKAQAIKPVVNDYSHLVLAHSTDYQTNQNIPTRP